MRRLLAAKPLGRRYKVFAGWMSLGKLPKNRMIMIERSLKIMRIIIKINMFFWNFFTVGQASGIFWLVSVTGTGNQCLSPT
ncbi:hypothetical protein GCM10025791_10240 [Halioxenophilus aromaticivorans]|uniref:Uncharacterized protein n=1 Tax=Halioxenophilus aromaticivorans TaxID=1306992 RepID=A0AAV3TZA5_9ALTE